jgi:hypothetical protein
VLSVHGRKSEHHRFFKIYGVSSSGSKLRRTGTWTEQGGKGKMSSKKPRTRVVKLFHKNIPYEVNVHCLPGVGDLVRLHLRGEAEPLFLKVKKAIYDIEQDGYTHNVEFHLNKAPAPVASILTRPRFQINLEWPHRAWLPRVADCVRFRLGGTAEPRELRIKNVIHDIRQAGKTHTIEVQVFDDSPQPLFSPEDIEAALTEEVAPLF